jgi:hypothetical protein
MNLQNGSNYIGKILTSVYLSLSVVLVLLSIFINPYWLFVIIFISFLSIPTIVLGGFPAWFGFLFPENFNADAVIYINVLIHIIVNSYVLYIIGFGINKIATRFRKTPNQ